MKTNCICKYLDSHLKMYVHHALSNLNISPNDALETYFNYVKYERSDLGSLISAIQTNKEKSSVNQSDNDEWDECI